MRGFVPAALAGALAWLAGSAGPSRAFAQTATWTGGNAFKNYSVAGNWNPAVVPLNGAGANYTVIVPDNNSLVYDVAGHGMVEALSFGAGSVLRLTNHFGLEVSGPALVKGVIEAAGNGSAFRAPANVTVLSANPRLWASEGGQIVVGASSYGWDRYNASATLLSAVGLGSLVDVKGVNSMVISYGDGGSWTYSVNARSNGVVDLSGLTQITGPGQDDFLEFNLDSGGNIKLEGLRRAAGRVRFNVGVPRLELPLLGSLSDTYLNVSTNSTLRLPALAAWSAGSLSLGAGAVVEASNLVTLSSVALSSSINSTLRLPALASFGSAAFTVGQGCIVEVPNLNSMLSANLSLGPGTVINAPNLTTMDNVPLNLTGDGTLLATNLAAYRNSDILAMPGRNFQPGPLTDIYSSRMAVRDGARLRAGAVSYELAPDWRAFVTLFSAVGEGSLLDLAPLKSVRVHGGHEAHIGYWNNAWTYSITADTNGVIDLSGLETAIGADPGNYNGDDWLVFNVRNGGNIRLNSLRQVTRRTQFNIQVARFDLPALELADRTAFNLANGTRLNAPNLRQLDACVLGFGFNSTLNAPNLVDFINSGLGLSPGVVLIAPPFTNVLGSRFAVSGGSVLHIGAPAYNGYPDWRWSPTLLSADGAGSLLDLAAVKSFRVYGGHGGSWTYSVLANNNGLVDLSGLETLTGASTSDYGNDDWLALTARNGGELRLSSLRQITGRTRFNLEVPQFELPLLETADSTTFALAEGTRLSLPNATRLSSCAINLAVNSTFDAPNLLRWENSSLSFAQNSACNVPSLLQLINMDLAVSPGRTFNSRGVTNIYASRLAVSGESTLQVAAPVYDAPADWRASPTLFSADGAGSLLDLSALQWVRVHGGHEAHVGYWNNAWTYSITAINGGVIDLSGLETAIGADPGNYNGDDWLAFNVQNGGRLLLDSLRQVTRRTRFNLAVPGFALPALETVDNTAFTLADDTELSLPSLTEMNSSSFTLGFNTTVEAPQLRAFVNSSVSLSPGKTLDAPPFTNLFASRLAVSGGSALRVAALAYDLYPDWRWSPTLFAADGIGALLDLASIKSLRVYGGHSGAWTYSIAANNGGLVDLGGVEQITGMDPAYGNDDWLVFNAANLGAIRFGNASVTRRTQCSASGTGSRLDFASLYLRPPATLNVNNRALLNVKGDLRFENTDPNSLVVETATVQLDGAQPQTLEVGGKNLGPTGASSRNFGYSLLIVGHSNQTSVVRLQDGLNNGQRGPSGESEALYLYGLDGQGLSLLNRSRLILNNVPVFAFLGGRMVQLNTLLSPTTNSLAFDAGFLANLGGPRITNMAPAGVLTPPLSSVEVTFDIPIEAASFTSSDVVLAGPGGPIAVGSVAVVSGNTYRIGFAPQAADGLYTVRIGPAIDEAAGNLSGMDQDSDGLSGEAGEDVFTGTFTLDAAPPVLVAAFALQNGARVGVTFDEPVAPAFATNPANYRVNGTAPTRALLQANGRQVALHVSALVGESIALSVANLADPLGNVTNRSFAGSILPMESRDLGSPGSNPREAGATLTFDGTDFEMSAGGYDYYWEGSDAGHFAFENRPGDFDVRVQVSRLDRADTYSQAGLMWRESTAPNSRRVYACVNHPEGGNNYWALVRSSPGSAGAEWPSYARPTVPAFPNVWVRLKRAGNQFIAYRGADGANWTEYARLTIDFPAAGLLGLATASRNNNAGAIATAYYRNYSDLGPVIIAPPQSQSVAAGSTVSFGVTARGLPTLVYQWLFNGLPIPGADTSLLTLPNVTTNQVGDYRVVVTNAHGAVTSQVATLIVDGVGAGGFEADVMPTPYGNNSVTVSDWVRVGRLVVGLESVLSSSEFMRADCAPRTNTLAGTLPLGNGVLSVADWTQAGRYAAGLDPLTAAGGPNAPAGGGVGLASLEARTDGSRLPRAAAQGAESGARLVRCADAKVVLGQSFSLPVELLGAGDENAVGFSLAFDPARLAYRGIELGEGAAGAALQVNAAQADQGLLGIVLAKPAGGSFAAGASVLIQARFTAIGSSGATGVRFSDQPAAREVASVTAEVQPAAYRAGAIHLVQPGRLNPQVRLTGGRAELGLSGEVGETYRVEASTDLVHWQLLETRTAGVGFEWIQDPAAGQFNRRFYRAVLEP
ncbi:MAG: hypothetical protein FJ387_15375 [Verrucomicrobia bacterium]|nr:hypothetical protein [Verrucomicrobiota bacterium]